MGEISGPASLPKIPELPVIPPIGLRDSNANGKPGPMQRIRPAAIARYRNVIDVTGLYEQLNASEPLILQVSCAGEAIVGWFTPPAGGWQKLASWPKRRQGPYPGVFVVDRGERVGNGWAMYWNSLSVELNELDPTDILEQIDPVAGGGDYLVGSFEIIDIAPVRRLRISFSGDSRNDVFLCVEPGRNRLPQLWIDQVKPEGPLREAVIAQHIRPLSLRMFNQRLDALLDPKGKPAALLEDWAKAVNPARRMLVPHVVGDLSSALHLPDNMGYEAELAPLIYERMMRQARTIDGIPRSHFDWYSMAVREDARSPREKKKPSRRLARMGFEKVEADLGYAYKISSTKVAVGLTVIIGGGVGGIRFHVRRYDNVRFKMDKDGANWLRDDAGIPIPVDPSQFEDPNRGTQLDGGVVSAPYLDGIVYELGVGVSLELGGGSANTEMMFYSNEPLGLDDFDGSSFHYTAVRLGKIKAGLASANYWAGYYASFTLTSSRRIHGVKIVKLADPSVSVPGVGTLAKAAEGIPALIDELTKMGFSMAQVAHTGGHIWQSLAAHDGREQSQREQKRPAITVPAAPVTHITLFDYNDHVPASRQSMLLGDGRLLLEVVLATHRIAIEGWTDLGIAVVGYASPEGTTDFNLTLSAARADWAAQAITDAFQQRIDRREISASSRGELTTPRLLDPPLDAKSLASWKRKHPYEVAQWRGARRVEIAIRGRPILIATSAPAP